MLNLRMRQLCGLRGGCGRRAERPAAAIAHNRAVRPTPRRRRAATGKIEVKVLSSKIQHGLGRRCAGRGQGQRGREGERPAASLNGRQLDRRRCKFDQASNSLKGTP